MNNSVCHGLLNSSGECFKYRNVPFYYSHKHSLINGFPDHYLALAAPVIAYWSLSLFFHYLDISGWKWLETYRIHDSAEVQKGNRVTRSQVIWGVLLQQVIQTLLGLLWLSDEAAKATNHASGIRAIISRLHPIVESVLGEQYAKVVLPDLGYFFYWWGIPTFQFFAAMYVQFLFNIFPSLITHIRRFIIDTWQYFLHRLMHINKFLYKQFHSWHHRLYVPYAFGSLYNHPLEGFFLDSLGAVLAEWLTGMNTRQAMLLFSFTTCKTVDDHCGYNLPFDPLQLMSGNNADYHDIHHQASAPYIHEYT